MSWEYCFLKRELGVCPHPALDLFEGFCERAYAVTDAMEWSWSFKAGRCRHERVFWLGEGGFGGLTSPHLKWLADELAFEPVGFPGGLAAWHDLLDHHTERIAVAYSGPDREEGRSAAIKLYLTLEPAALQRAILVSILPRVPLDTPIECATVVLCHAVYERGETHARVYLMFNQAAFEDPAISNWFGRNAGDPAIEIAKSHVRTGLSFKTDTTDMLGIGFRPSDLKLKDHPSWWNSPVLDPVFYVAGSMPLLRERLGRLSWVTVPVCAQTPPFPLEVPEMNVYVKLV